MKDDAEPNAVMQPPSSSSDDAHSAVVVRKRGPLFRVSYAVDRAMRTFFFRVGYLVAAHPLKTIALALLLTALSLAGMLRFRTESRAEQLWVPQGTVALSNREYVVANYGQSVRLARIAFVAREGDGLANKQAFNQMLDVAEQGWKIQAGPIDKEGSSNTVITWPERCLNSSDVEGNSVCSFSSAFNLFYDTEFVVKNDDDTVNFFQTVRDKINSLDDTDIKRVLSAPPPTNDLQSPFIAEEIIGGTSGSGDTFDFKIMLFTQFINNNQTDKDGNREDVEAQEIEEKWTTFLLEDTALLNGRSLDWYVESFWSQDDSLEQALNGDLPLLSGGFVLLTVYVVLFLGDFHVVRSHMWLAVGALLTTGLALGTCFGLSSAFGMFFGPVHQILPLLIVGIGIDDCFHVTRALDDINLQDEHKHKPLRTRVALALSLSGSAITVTSFTNVVVFLLSAISRLPALRFFSLWAAIGIFFAWVYSVTFFAALLSLDARRQGAKRRDCCPCLPPLAEVSAVNWFKKRPAGFSRFFRNWFGPFIMRPVVRAVLLVALTGWLAACCYGVSQLYLKFKFSFFYPSGSAQREFQDQVDVYFKLGDRTRVHVRDVDLSSAENQRRLLRLCASNGVVARNRWVQADAVDCWYEAMRRERGLQGDAVVPAGQFATAAAQFVGGGAGRRYVEDVVFSADGSRVDGCRFAAQYVYRGTNEEEIEALKSLRSDADSVGFGNAADGNAAAFPYTFQDTFTEQYDALPGEIGLSLGLASVAVAVVCVVLVGHPSVAAVCVLVVGVIIIDVLGLTYFSGVNLNSVSVITLVLCTGISVDFVVHIARAFLEQVGSRGERAIGALATMGPPVFYAGFSTLLAIVVLAFARSYIFQVIFKGFLFLILMGFVHGLVAGPLILSLVGARSFYGSEAERSAAERALEQRVLGEKSVDAGAQAQAQAQRIEGGVAV